ncbi:MAG TPA: PD-(D/E)XK nuclease family protein, partial [Verrucomicrobiota bacterium]|nr:PD-(D/E)XK nuclease family protein [Verrucomicrobiota bacterium]
PDGLPLIFIAPKQFTYQLERQILSDPEIKGYTRLLIFSFERFANYIISDFSHTKYNILSETGKTMALRSILSRLEPSLKAYGKSIRHPGFSAQLSQVLEELQSFGISVGKLREGAKNTQLPISLRDKLEDLALILENYQNWLEQNGLLDSSRLLEAATDVVSKGIDLKIDSLWLDGFAMLSDLQIEFLTKILSHCEKATLAFCVDEDASQTNDCFSRNTFVKRFFSKCKAKIEEERGCEIFTQFLKTSENRFKNQPALEYIQKHWGDFSIEGFDGNLSSNDSEWWNEGGIKIISCSNPLAEVVSAARTIRQYVRMGGRYRDIAILMRRMDDYHDLIRRIFYNYEIPFFLDRREAISHHPIAELIRYALRLVCFGWQQEDLFGALKLGFAPIEDFEIDWFENQALANGWSGKAWQMPLSISGDEEISKKLEEIRKRVIQPLINFEKNVMENQDSAKSEPVGIQVANAIRELFIDWNVEYRLERWRDELVSSNFRSYLPPSMHQTALEEINNLLENFELAFGKEKKGLTEWLQIIETGLSGLTVGVIPPSLDQVLIGAIDRSRNPELKLVIVIGLNEESFPETPKFSPLLNESERKILADKNIYNGFSLQMLLALEWYYGYIACTRASKYLYLSYPVADWSGKPLNSSPFITHIQKLFPKIEPVSFSGIMEWNEAEHPKEMASFIANKKFAGIFAALKSLGPIISRLSQQSCDVDVELASKSALKILIGDLLKISVSSLEDYADCPFKCFVKHILRAEERNLYKVDSKHTGLLRHSILEEFHKSLEREDKKWRDLDPEEAAERIGIIADKVIDNYNNKLFASNPSNIFQANVIVDRLKDFIFINVKWLKESYCFDPTYVELSFGLENSKIPPLEIQIDKSRKMQVSGKIDRLDIFFGDEEDCPCVVVDYKSSLRKIDDNLLRYGIELQLPAYLLLLYKIKKIPKEKITEEQATEISIKPVGVFYVNLSGNYQPVKNRTELIQNSSIARIKAYQYHGRFNADFLKYLDKSEDGENSGQFNYRLTKDKQINAKYKEGMKSEAFEGLIKDTENFLIKYGESIFNGDFKVDPWRKQGDTKACDNCSYQTICRIDIMNHNWRILK